MTFTRLGSYPIEREVGRGGMGVVYLGVTIPAERTLPGISVAVDWRAGREE